MGIWLSIVRLYFSALGLQKLQKRKQIERDKENA
jgi:hypothetical protein